NSGNANCCTGPQGERDTHRMAQLAAEALGLPADQIAVASTGVIGQLLDMAKVESGIGNAAKVLGTDPNPFMDAILTTDLVEKWAWSNGETMLSKGSPAQPNHHEGGCIYGVSKGSGMIAPN